MNKIQGTVFLFCYSMTIFLVMGTFGFLISETYFEHLIFAFGAFDETLIETRFVFGMLDIFWTALMYLFLACSFVLIVPSISRSSRKLYRVRHTPCRLTKVTRMQITGWCIVFFVFFRFCVTVFSFVAFVYVGVSRKNALTQYRVYDPLMMIATFGSMISIYFLHTSIPFVSCSCKDCVSDNSK